MALSEITQHKQTNIDSLRYLCSSDWVWKCYINSYTFFQKWAYVLALGTSFRREKNGFPADWLADPKLKT